MIRYQIELFNALNDESVAGLIAIVPVHLSCSHFSVRTRDLPLRCFQSVKFLKTNISLGSVATPFR